MPSYVIEEKCDGCKGGEKTAWQGRGENSMHVYLPQRPHDS